MFMQVNRIHSYNYLKWEQRTTVKRAHHVDLQCCRTVFSSLLPQSRSSQNVQAHQQANQVNGQTQETAAEHSACDTRKHNNIRTVSQCPPHHHQQICLQTSLLTASTI